MAGGEVVVTGMGAMTPVGADLHASWDALTAGASGISTVEEPWAADLPVRLVGQLPVDPAASLSYREGRRLDRCEQMALVTAREAWGDAGTPAVEPERLSVAIGTGIGGVRTTLSQQQVLREAGPRKLSPHAITMLMANGPAAWVSIDLGARGGARTPVSACASGAEAIADGMEMIRRGSADVVVAGGVEAPITGLTLGAFAQMKALSTRHDDPAGASRPFDADRDGFVLGEGAGLVVLERAEFARARGARVYATIAGAGMTSDAHDIVAADPAGQARAIRIALRTAGLAPTDIGLVHAHATSTPVGDPLEAEAITQAIGNHAAVTASKSMTGHLLGASGAIGAIVAILSLHHKLIPPTRNLERLDPAIKLDIVTDKARQENVQAAIGNSFGFGGHNVTLAFAPA